MKLKELESLIKNKKGPDNEVYKAIKELIADKFDRSGKIIPPGEKVILLGKLTRKLRPKVMERLRKDIMRQHKKCCGHGPGT